MTDLYPGYSSWEFVRGSQFAVRGFCRVFLLRGQSLIAGGRQLSGYFYEVDFLIQMTKNALFMIQGRGPLRADRIVCPCILSYRLIIACSQEMLCDKLLATRNRPNFRGIPQGNIRYPVFGIRPTGCSEDILKGQQSATGDWLPAASHPRGIPGTGSRHR